MSPRTITRILADSSEIILRWSDAPHAPVLESPVKLVNPENTEPTVRAPLRVGEETPVTLLADGNMVNGIVRFCLADKESYLITVSRCEMSKDRWEAAGFRDPGSLAVDDFLTEEEEAKILESLGDLLRSTIKVPDQSLLLQSLRLFLTVVHPSRSTASLLPV